MPHASSRRTSGAQLPSAKELFAILDSESPRKAVRFDFLATHPEIFAAHHTLSKQANSSDDWIETYASIDLEELLVSIESNHKTLAEYILHNPSQQALYEKLYTSLIPEEDTSTSDTLFVFGAQTNARILRAIELYKAEVAPKIIISGNRPFYKETDESEAARMAAFAVENGVLSESLLLEEKSITLPDNVKRTLDLLESKQWKPLSVTLVATDFVLQRARMEWYKFTPWDITIKTIAAAAQSTRFTKEGWCTDKETIALVLNEYAKLVIESKIDLMRMESE